MRISKYNSCDNIFLITIYKERLNYSLIAKDLCNKHEADGLLIFKNDPMELLIFNKDGSEAKMCGNGARVLIHYLYNRFRIYNYIKIKTKSGFYDCQITNKEPFISSVHFPFNDIKINKNKIRVHDKEFEVNLLDAGVLHAVIISEDFTADSKYIVDIFNHDLFKGNVNINLVKPLNSSVFEMLTYERGVGFTKSCGTGAIAASYFLHKECKLESHLIAICPGGILRVYIDENIVLTGESFFVEDFEVDL